MSAAEAFKALKDTDAPLPKRKPAPQPLASRPSNHADDALALAREILSAVGSGLGHPDSVVGVLAGRMLVEHSAHGRLADLSLQNIESYLRQLVDGGLIELTLSEVGREYLVELARRASQPLPFLEVDPEIDGLTRWFESTNLAAEADGLVSHDFHDILAQVRALLEQQPQDLKTRLGRLRARAQAALVEARQLREHLRAAQERLVELEASHPSRASYARFLFDRLAAQAQHGAAIDHRGLQELDQQLNQPEAPSSAPQAPETIAVESILRGPLTFTVPFALSEKERRALECLARNGQASSSDLREILGRRAATTMAMLEERFRRTGKAILSIERCGDENQYLFRYDRLR